MASLLVKAFVRDCEQVGDTRVRARYGTLSGAVGIAANVLLFAAKLAVGTLAGSVSIVADAVNNLSDAGSSIISLLGFKISEKPADRDHPFGHGRTEYVAGLIIAFLILLLGFELGRTSLDKVLHPAPVETSAVTLAVLAGSIACKVWLWSFNRRIGRAISSTTILATAQDSLNDVVATSAVLAAAVVSLLTPLNLDGYMGLAVAAFILFSGYGVAKDTLGPLLGQAPDSALVSEISRKVLSHPQVLGIHDLMVHNYGPGRTFASLHAEVDSSADILQSHDLIDNIEKDLAQEMGIQMVIHMDPIVTNNDTVNALRQTVLECVQRVRPDLSIHDFRAVLGETHSNLIFDVMVPVDCPVKNHDLCTQIGAQLREVDPRYNAVITVDRGYQVDYGERRE